MDMNIETSHIVEVSTAPSSSPKKVTVPLINLERFPTQQEIEGQDARNRRPVRPIDRQRMRPWLMELLDMGNVFGLRWTNRHLGIFQISWRHASRLGWNLETDGDVFERWARHTGIYKEGDPPEPKRWKANFRCALHSLTDVLELTNAVERRGRNACRTYQFLQNSSASTPKTKTKKQKTEVKVQRTILPLITYEQPPPEPEPLVLLESASSDDILSETESEGSQKDKVIVQRLEAKSQDTGEDFILLHDHDYSAGPLKTQKTIYLRQGVGSIVLQKEVQNIPEDAEEIKSYLLSNLDQLASAAVSETIAAQKSPVSRTVDSQNSLGSLNRISPTKAVFDLTFNESSDKTENSFKNLLPRLRARLKESGKFAGTVRKRKGTNIEVDLEDLDYLELKGKGKKEKIEKHGYPLAPPSPPLTRRRSAGSPKKGVKVVAKSKRTRKESEESTSDSTEPLMSSCLLLLEAATRLDNAEKNGGTSGRASSKATKKGTASAQNSTTEGKRRPSGRILRFDKEAEEEPQPESDTHEESFEEERLEIVIQDGIQDTAEVSQEMIIEEEVYPDNAIQLVYEIEEEQHVQAEMEQAEVIESPVDSAQYHEILRTALENIGSELEVSTVDSSSTSSSPKEMAIMRRKKDGDKTIAQNPVESPGNNEISVPKGLFSGSEIITENQQPLSIVRKRIKGKSKSSSKDNIYYVDIRANGGSICVKQSDDVEAEEEEEPVSSPSPKSVVKNSIGIQQTVIKRELPVLNTPTQKPSSTTSTNFLQTHNNSSNSSQIFIATAQNTTGQQIIVPISSGELGANSSENQTYVIRDSLQAKQLLGQSSQGGSFITLGPQGKTLLYKSDSSGKTVIPLLNPVVSSSVGPNVKISTLPIASSVKPLVNISTPVSGDKVADQTVLTNSDVPFKFVPKMSQTVSSNTTPTQLAAISSGGKAWILQPRKPAPVSQVSKATTIRMIPPCVKAIDQTIITIPGMKRDTDKSTPSSSAAAAVAVNPTVQSVSILPKRSDDVLVKSETATTNVQVVNVPSDVVIDPAQGSSLPPPLCQFSISEIPLSTSPLSHSNDECTVASQEEVVTSPSTSLCTSVMSESHASVSIKNEVHVTETVVISSDILETALSTSKDGYDLSNTSQVSSSSSLMPASLPESITTIKEEIKSEDTLTEVDISGEHGPGLGLQSSPDLITVSVSQESEGNASTYQIIENLPESSSSTVAFDIVVKTEANDQQVFVSPEQGEQIGQTVHASQTILNEAYELSEMNDTQQGEPVIVEAAPEATVEEICLETKTKEHHNDAISIDPRNPLPIGEIPLFAISKGDIDYSENSTTD